MDRPENCNLTAERTGKKTKKDQDAVEDQANDEKEWCEDEKDATHQQNITEDKGNININSDYFQEPYEPGELYQNQLADPKNMWHLFLESENSGDELPDL